MGNLKPGATYIYERDGSVTYAREFGADPASRVVIGWDYDPTVKDNIILWGNIVNAGKSNPALQKVLDNAIMLYKLSIEKNE